MVKVSLLVPETSLEQVVAGHLMSEYDTLNSNTSEYGYKDRLERMALMSAMKKIIAHYTTEEDYKQWIQVAGSNLEHANED